MDARPFEACCERGRRRIVAAHGGGKQCPDVRSEVEPPVTARGHPGVAHWTHAHAVKAPPGEVAAIVGKTKKYRGFASHRESGREVDGTAHEEVLGLLKTLLAPGEEGLELGAVGPDASEREGAGL